jgi:hypothetical protein
MGFVNTAGNNILVDSPDSVSDRGNTPSAGSTLVSWLIGKAVPWESFRNRGYQRRWGEYWRLWRGMFAQEDKNRQSERSRLIAPALSQAIEMTVAEIEEGLFSKEVWFDITDDIADNEKLDALIARDNLLEDFERANIKDAVSEAVLVGSIFGSGIVKLNVDIVPESRPERSQRSQRLEQSTRERVLVTVESIRPDEFIPDPAGRNIHEMLGCFHRVTKPLHSILEKIESGVYRRDALSLLGSHTKNNENDVDNTDPQSFLQATDSDQVEILEYHGKVPMNLLNSISSSKATPLDAVLEKDIQVRPDAGDGPMIEAIVTVANNSVLLRAMANPFVMKDRSIISFQFEKVPGRFWGRGVAEKGFNPQKALDAELRARIDALGFISSPMIGVDSGRIPRGFRMEVKPGKIWLTQGPPNDILQPVNIGDLKAATFSQADAMERMVQMGTGAFDTATTLRSQGSQSNGPSPTNTSLMMGAFVKRAKRAIRNVNDNLMYPMITKSLWRYMQFDPLRYQRDFKFIVKPTLGIVAREVEAMQLTQLMGMLPEDFPQVNIAVAQGIIDLSSVHNKASIMQAMEQALAPPSPEEQARQQQLENLQFEATKAEAEGALLVNQKTLAEIRKILSETILNQRKADVADDQVIQEQQRIEIQNEELEVLREQNDLALKRLDIQEKQVEAKLRQLNNTND